MKPNYLKTYYTTLSINRFVPVFRDFPETIFIILDSFHYLVKNKKIQIYAFVIMKDHLHIIWETNKENEIEEIITSFKKHTGKKIIDYLKSFNNNNYHENFMSIRKDRNYKIWKQPKGNLKIKGKKILINKIKYIHNNPIKGDYKSVNDIIDYYFSSAFAYSMELSNFAFLTVLKNIVP